MYRMIDAEMWADPWFSELAPGPKLLFVYLFTNPRTNAAGAYGITARQMAFDTGLTVERVEEHLAGFGDRVVWWPELRVVWVKNFHRRQFANEKFRESARRALAGLTGEVGERVCREYPQLRDPSRPHPQETDTHPVPIAVGTDTHTYREGEDSVATELGQQSGQEEEGGAPAPGADAPRPASEPYALFQALCEERGVDETDVKRDWMRTQLGIAKALVADDYTEADIRGHLRYLATDPYWTAKPIDFKAVKAQIGAWVANKRPPIYVPEVKGRASPNGARAPTSKAQETEARINGFAAIGEGGAR